MDDFEYDFGICNYPECRFESKDIGDLKVFKSKFLGDDYVNCYCFKHYDDKVSEEDEQIKGFIKSKIVPIDELLKPEHIIQYIVINNYTSNIISPITENNNSINTTNNIGTDIIRNILTC